MATKTERIERFKSHNSILRNSLLFLPTAAEEVRAAASEQRLDSREGRALPEVNRILLATLIYSEAPSTVQAEEIDRRVDALLADTQGWSSQSESSAATFVNHVSTVLREQDEVNTSLRDIAAARTTERLDDIGVALNEDE